MPDNSLIPPEPSPISKPSYSLWTWCKFFALQLLILPFIWSLIKFLVNYFVGERVGKRIFAAQNYSQYEIMLRTFEMNTILEEAVDISSEKFVVHTYDGAQLDTIAIRNKTLPKDNQQPYIINFLGTSQYYQMNSASYPMVDMLINDARALNCNIIGFNFRGVGTEDNKPRSENDLVTDGIAQVQRLLNQNIAPDKIVLNGVSLGAGVATLVVEHFHNNGINIRLFNDRSFSSMTDVIVGWIRIGDLNRFLAQGPAEIRNDEIRGYSESRWNILLGWVAWPFIKLALSLTKWDINAGAAYANISKKDKACMYISSLEARKSGENPPVDDCIISSFAQIKSRIKPNKLHAAAMQTIDEQPDHDGHFKMRNQIINSCDKNQTGQDFFYSVLRKKFNFHDQVDSDDESILLN